MGEAMLAIRGLEKRYPIPGRASRAVRALDGVDLDLGAALDWAETTFIPLLR